MAALLQAPTMKPLPARPSVSRRPVALRSRPALVCRAAREEQPSHMQKMMMPLAAAVATALVSGAIVPEEALAARSGGRAGGSSGFQSRKAPVQQTTSQTTVIQNTYVAPPVMAPPVYGGFGGFGFGGFSIMPTFVVPIPFGLFGSLIGMFFLLFVVSAIFNAVRSTASSSNKTNDWDD